MKRYMIKSCSLEELTGKIGEYLDDTDIRLEQESDFVYRVIGKRGNHINHRVARKYDMWCLKYIGY